MNIKEFNIFFSNHAVKQMFSRSITTTDVKAVIEMGESIKDYPEDRPYEPTTNIWENNFKTRKTK